MCTIGAKWSALTKLSICRQIVHRKCINWETNKQSLVECRCLHQMQRVAANVPSIFHSSAQDIQGRKVCRRVNCSFTYLAEYYILIMRQNANIFLDEEGNIDRYIFIWVADRTGSTRNCHSSALGPCLPPLVAVTLLIVVLRFSYLICACRLAVIEV